MANRKNNDHDRLQEVWHAIKDDDGLQVQVTEIRRGLLGDPLHPELPGMFAQVQSHIIEHGRIENELAIKVKAEATALAIKTRRETKLTAAIIAGVFSLIGVCLLWIFENIEVLMRMLKR